jgi:hypothetical protein
VTEICEKGVTNDNLKAYIGLAGIYDYQCFWKAMAFGAETSIAEGESYGMNSLLASSTVSAHEFKWFDTGNVESLKVARDEYHEPNSPNILRKSNESIWFVSDKVIKYSDDVDFISNRVKRAKELKGFVPDIYSFKDNMYCYKKVKGKVLSEIISQPIFDDFLIRCKAFWLQKDLGYNENQEFRKNCLKFYKDKTIGRVELFYKNYAQKDNALRINGQHVPQLQKLLDQVDWKWLSLGLPGRFHGDFHFENILYSKDENKFSFLDWRQDFAGDLTIGDIYYDLAKLMHGLIVNHGVIADDLYSASWRGDEINFDLPRKQILVECELKLNTWIQENSFDLKKVRVLTALIYLNIAPLHHYPYSILLYGLGKKMLSEEIEI